jgi:ATP-binding cassette subfamily D (ALD) protein 3
MIAYFVMSGVLLRAFSPPFGRCKYTFQLGDMAAGTNFIIIIIIIIDTAIEQKLEGDFRFTHVSKERERERTGGECALIGFAI